jgi:hypothetical protein
MYPGVVHYWCRRCVLSFPLIGLRRCSANSLRLTDLVGGLKVKVAKISWAGSHANQARRLNGWLWFPRFGSAFWWMLRIDNDIRINTKSHLPALSPASARQSRLVELPYWRRNKVVFWRFAGCTRRVESHHWKEFSLLRWFQTNFISLVSAVCHSSLLLLFYLWSVINLGLFLYVYLLSSCFINLDGLGWKEICLEQKNKAFGAYLTSTLLLKPLLFFQFTSV